jgi:uncharacterized membrane protein YphA (DoxX/SURF4 family)
MNTILWICQAILAITFLYSGINKSIFSTDQLVTKGQTGVANLPLGLTRFIGISEIIGSIGIIVPWWINIWPFLTPVTAICFVVIMLLAAPIHYKRKEPQNVATNLILLAISLFVVWGRFSIT